MLSGLSGLSGLSAVCGGCVEFSPTQLTGYVDSPYSIALLRSQGKLWQDAGKTVAATADGDPVRVVVCGSTDYTAPSDAARPLLWDEGSGKWSLSFDGVDDIINSPSLGLSDFEWLCCVKRLATDSNYRQIFSVQSQAPAIKSYLTTFVDGDYRIYDGDATLDRCVGSSPGLGDTPWHTVGLSRASGRVYGRVSGTDYDSGLTQAATFGVASMMSRVISEYTPGRVAGLAIFSSRLGTTDRATLDTYLAALAP